MMNKTDKIYVAGHRGMVGSAIVRKLEKEGFENLLLQRFIATGFAKPASSE